jgi:hypothetical protein
MAQVCLWLGFARIPGRAGGAVREVEDISYGVYILHWPAGQILMNTFPGLPTPILFAMMAVSAILLGWLMRVGVEKPMLALKPALASRLALFAPRRTEPAVQLTPRPEVSPLAGCSGGRARDCCDDQRDADQRHDGAPDGGELQVFVEGPCEHEEARSDQDQKRPFERGGQADDSDPCSDGVIPSPM